MDHQLHAAAFVEKALGNYSLLSRDRTQNCPALQDVFDRLFGAGIIESAFLLEPVHGCRHIGLRRGEADRRRMGQHLTDLLPQISDVLGKFLGPGQCFASPKRHTGRGPMRILHQHAAGVGFDAANHPRSISQQHNVAAIAFHGEVFIHGTDDKTVRLRNHGIKRVVGDRSAAGDRRQPGSAPPSQLSIYSIAVNIGAIAAALCSDAFGQHFQNCIERRPGEITVRIGAPHQGEHLILAPLFGGTSRHDLLRQHIQRRVRNHQPVQIALADGAHQRRTLEQIIARGGKQASFRNCAAPVTGAPHALQSHRNRARRIDLHHQVHRADIDSEFERRGRHQHPHLAFFQLLLCR